MSKPTSFPVAPSLTPTTEVYTQRQTAGGAEANFRFTLQAIYNFFKTEFGFSDTLRHVQGAASTTWTINHTLGVNPVVQTFVNGPSGEIMIEGLVTHPSLNQTIITFNTAYSGFALLNP